MITHDVVQGSVQWVALRLGMPTASNFHRIVTPTGKLSTQADGYLRSLLVEWALGVPADSTDSQWMQRGRDQEEAAVSWYEFTRDVTAQRAGFVTVDRGDIGCSPDGLVPGGGGIEVKTLSAPNHIGALLGETDDKYYPQVQGCMWITERAWWDRIWWHHVLPPVVVRVERDEAFIAKLAFCVPVFAQHLEDAKEKLFDAGVRPKLESKRAMARDLAEFDRIVAEKRL